MMMKRQVKRMTGILLAGVMTLGLLSGCGGKDKEEAKGDNTLTVGIPLQGTMEGFEENALTKYVEESLGITIEFETYVSGATERTQQLTMQATGGQKLPDVLWGFQGTSLSTIYEFGEAGYFQDLTDLIDKYAVNYKEHFEKLDKEDQDYINDRGTAPDGGFYGMPLFSAYEAIDDLQNMMYINQSWLDAVGMKAPTNIQELKAVLEAFRDKDPNGNGMPDEIPMLGKNISAYVINAFQYFDTSYLLNVENGKVTPSYTSDEYRQALIFLKELCDEGLYSDLSITMSSDNEFKSLITPADKTSKVGIFCGHPSLVTSVTNPVLNEYVALDALSDATGKGGYTVIHPKTLMFCGFITKDCENTELAMKFLDFFYNDETVTRMRYGEKGVHWEEATGKSMYGTDAYFKILNSDSSSSRWGFNGSAIFTYENYSSVHDETVASSRLMQGSAQILTTGKKATETTAHLTYTQEEDDSKALIEGMLNTKVTSMRDQFITGKKDPSNNSDWNSYLKELEDLQMSDLVKLYQAAYDRG